MPAFDALYAKATAAAETRDFDRAIQYYDEAIAADPSRAETHYKRANALRNLGRLEEAIAGYDAAIVRKPDYAYAYCNRGVVQQNLGRFAEAVASFDKAAALDPADPLVPYNRALLMQDFGRWEEALTGYDRTIALSPGHADAHFNRSLVQLFCGSFTQGWLDFEWRWKNAARLGIGAAAASFSQPLWLGQESIAGKRLLLQSEAGLGDTIQFCRYATACAALGATVILEVQPALVDLLDTLKGVSRVIAKGNPLPAFDYHCPLMSLPLAFKTTLDSIPAAPRYLSTDPARVAQWREALGARTRPRVGLVWSGNPNNPIDAKRSIPLAQWVPHLPRELQYFCLQNEVRAADQKTLATNPFIFDLGNMNFVSTAAFCECMDVVLCVDTSIAHLGGALGQRTWLLLPAVPDWRWLRNRDDSPWYPSMRLYRQTVAGDWQDVFRQLAADLRALITP
jgi:Tfp pilus assembly protein PilF